MARTTDIDVHSLYVDAINVQPIHRDWSTGYDFEGYGDDEHGWTFFEAVELDDGRVTDGLGYIDDDPDDSYIDERREGPMMNYAYPLPAYRGNPVYDARSLVHLPLCIVQEGDETFLALTGGGMDLSWEICEAYMRLGYLPPLHFADLPRMAGRGESPDDRTIIAACKRSAEVAIGWAQRTLENLNAY